MNVGINADLVVTFDETIVKGSGNISIFRGSDDALIGVVDVNSANVTIAGAVVTINPPFALDHSTAYYVQIPNSAFDDTANNSFAGILDKTTWNFSSEADAIAPLISALSPADNASNVPRVANLVMTFDEDIQKGSGSIVVRRTSNHSTVTTVDVSTSSVTVAGAVATIDLPFDLDYNTGYYVQVSAGAFSDMAMNDFAGISNTTDWNFTTVPDTAPPTVTTLLPADDATNVLFGADLVVTFNETIAKGSGLISVFRSSDDSLFNTINVASAEVTVSGAIATIDPAFNLEANTSYYIQIAAGAFTDTAANDFAGILDKTTWNFSTNPDGAAPTVQSLNPLDNATGVDHTNDLVITFNEIVQKGTGQIRVHRSSDDVAVLTHLVTSSAISVAGEVVTIDTLSALSYDTAYYVQIDAGAIQDPATNNFAGILDKTTWNFATAPDVVPPVITNLNPADGSTNVDVDTNLVVTFSENIQKGTGLISIFRSSDDGLIGVVDVTSGQVTISSNMVTINPSFNLEYATDHYIQIPASAFEDVTGGNDFAGILDKTSWNFTTGTETIPPTLQSTTPLDNATNIALDTNLTMVFDEPIQKGTGSISIISGVTLVASIDVNDAAVTVSGATVTIDPPSDLDYETNYNIRMPAGTFKDLSMNDFAGINFSTIWNFSTLADPFPSFQEWLDSHPGADPGGLTLEELRALDLDFDGLTLWEEFGLGGDPNVADASLRAPRIVDTGSGLVLRFFRATTRVVYTIRTSGNPAGVPWIVPRG